MREKMLSIILFSILDIYPLRSEIFEVKLKSGPKLHQIWHDFSPLIFFLGGGQASKLLNGIIKLNMFPTLWQNFVVIGWGTS